MRAGKPRRSPRHKPEEARCLITEQATRFLQERPYRDLTVAGLMAGTPLSWFAFYQYFDDLPHLIRVLLQEVEAAMLRKANPWIRGEGEHVAALRKALGGVVRTGVTHGPVLRAVADAAPNDVRLEAAWNEFMGRWDDAVETRILAQQEAGLIAPCDARATAFALNRLDASVLVEQFGTHPQPDPEKILDVLHRIWVGALYGFHPPETVGGDATREIRQGGRRR
jgi:AcrR family transcriptional regulator